MGNICSSRDDIMQMSQIKYAKSSFEKIKSSSENFQGYEETDIQEFVGSAISIEAVDLSQYDRLSCIDGRSKVKSLGSAGGDASLFLLGLTSYEKVTKSQISQAHFQILFKKYLAKRKQPMYMHTDMNVVEAMFKHLNKDQLYKNQLEKYFLEPSPELQQELIPLIVKPEFIGCGHLRLTTTNHDTYQIRKELIDQFIVEFYTLLWKKDPKVKLEILEGKHEEKAVCIFESSTNDTAPLIQPLNSDNKKSSFIYHPKAEEIYRIKLAQLLCMEMENQNIEEELIEKMNEIGEIQFNFTCEKLASKLPQFKVKLLTF